MLLAAVDGLMALIFGVEVFAFVTFVLGMACLYAYRMELRSGYLRALGKSNRSFPREGQSACKGWNAVKEDPGNGWRVGCLIMAIEKQEEAEDLHRDFKARPIKAKEVYVDAALAIRQHREEGETLLAEVRLWHHENPLTSPHDRDEFMKAWGELSERFPNDP